MLFFIIYLFLETIISVQISSSIGGFYTFLEMIATVIIGMFILKNLHIGIMESLNAFREEEITHAEFQRLNLLSVLGAIFLIIPGFFTDIVGILFQFDFFALIVFRRYFKKHNSKEEDINFHYSNKNIDKKGNDEIIDVEIIDTDSKH